MSNCCTIHTYEKRTESFGQLLVMEQRYDPTRTTTLRNRFAREMRKRFVKLQREVREAIVDKDVFGMQAEQFGQPLLTQVERQAFDFPRSQDKVTAFMEWLQGRVDSGILEIRQGEQLGEAVEHAWTNQYVEDSYKRGVQRATYEMQKAGYPVTGIEERGGMQVVMNTPFHMDRVGLLYSRVYSDLRGVTTAMDTQISRVLSQGMADGDGPRLLARKINAAISGVGAGDLGITDTLGRFIPAKRRAEMIARTEIIRAHHQATIQEYRNWRVAGVRVKAEWRTAGDDRVCEECEMLAFSEWTLDEIEKAIPVHPHCRCIALPLDVTDKGVPVEEEDIEYPGDTFDQTGQRTHLLAQHEEQLDNYISLLPDQNQVNAINQYTRAAYTDINRDLRKGIIDPRDKNIVKGLDEFFAHAPRYQGEVFRGIRDPKIADQFIPGNVITMDAYTSATLNADQAKAFTEGIGGLMMKIKGRNGVSIRNISTKPEEAEILFKRGTKFKVIAKEERGIHYWIDLEEL